MQFVFSDMFADISLAFNCAIHGVTQSFSNALLTSYLEDNVYIICFLR